MLFGKTIENAKVKFGFLEHIINIVLHRTRYNRAVLYPISGTKVG